MAIGTRRHKLLTGDDVGSLVRWTVANSTARLALILTADDNGALAKQTDDNSYHILAAYATPTWVQLGNVTNNTSAAVAPTVDDDELDGFAIGDGWVDTVTDSMYVLTDATAGAANWVLLGTSGAVTTVFGRSGTVVAAVSDYDASQVDNDSGVTGSTVKDALDTLNAASAPVDSVFGRTGAVVAVAGDYDDTEVTHASVIGTPTIDTVAEVLDATGGVSKRNGGGGITDDTDGTVTIGAGEGRIRATDSDTAALLSFDWASTPITPADNDLTYLYVEYNAGTPQVVGTVTKRTDLNTNIYLGAVYRTGTFLHITEHAYPMGNIGQRLVKRFNDTSGLTRATGSVLSDPSDLSVVCTAGVWWHGLDEVSIAAFDTGVADTFFRFYRDGAGDYTLDATETLINVLNYDDGTGTLATLSAGRYGVHWVYVGVDNDLYIIFGRGNYTAAQWSASSAPTDLPAHMQEQHAGLIGRIVVQKSAAVYTDVSTAFETTFALEQASDHGNLGGLGDDDHTQYLRADGTRELTDDMTVTALKTIDGRDLSVDGAKLDAIEAAADVTDTANVTAAGALMDSEVDANLKTFALPASTTITAFGGTLVDDADAAAARTTLDAARANLSGAGAPGVATGNGYPLGTTYADTTGDDGYILVDATVGANVWSSGGGGGDVVGPAGASDNAFVRFNGTTGKLIASLSTATLSDNTEMKLSGIRAHLELEDRSVVPTPAAGHGTHWVKDDALVTPMFTPVTGTHLVLGSCHALKNGGTTNGSNITDWLGPVTSDFYGAANNTSYGAHSGDPTATVTTAARIANPAPFNGYIERVDMVALVSNATLAGEFHLWNFHCTDGSTTVTATDLGTIAAITAGGSTTNARTFSITPGITATVVAGDTLLVLYKGSGSVSANYFWHTTAVIRETS